MQLYLEFIKSKEKQINPKAMDIWQVLNDNISNSNQRKTRQAKATDIL